VANVLEAAKLVGVSGTMVGIFYAASASTTMQALQWVPYQGVWGWLGYGAITETTVSVTLAAAQPYLIPVIAVSGSVAVVTSEYRFHQCQKKWQEMTEVLNKRFLDSQVVVASAII